MLLDLTTQEKRNARGPTASRCLIQYNYYQDSLTPSGRILTVAQNEIKFNSQRKVIERNTKILEFILLKYS